MSHRALLLFARAPVVGQAKTRLIPALGAAGAAALHAGLVEHTLQTACRGGHAVQLWCHPHTRHRVFRECADRFPLSLHTQRGADLGARMAHALATALQDYERAVLIGTDCPALSDRDLDAGFAALDDGADVVLGPAADGGYYLVGLRQRQDEIFGDIAWGSGAVLSQTLSRLRQYALDYRLLATRQDLDTPADLAAFREWDRLMQRGKQLVELDR